MWCQYSLINYPDLEYVHPNPWSTVEDLSEFLNYCCPECDYTDKFEQSFSYHALQNHKNSTVFFASNKNKLSINKHGGSNKVKSNADFFTEYEDNQHDFVQGAQVISRILLTSKFGNNHC